MPHDVQAVGYPERCKPATLTAGRLRALTTAGVLACSPVEFRDSDGRLLALESWAVTTNRGPDGKPMGSPRLVIQLGEDGRDR